MLTDKIAIEIIAGAKQKNVRDPNRSREHFYRIFEDYLSNDNLFNNRKIIDLGPGQYDFSELASAKGAMVDAIDFDPVVVKLGNYLGYRCMLGQIQKIAQLPLPHLYDGLFCKFSINAFWFINDNEAHRKFINCLFSILDKYNWVWVAPWNGIPKSKNINDRQIDETLNMQKMLFKNHGCLTKVLTEDESKYYGIHGNTENRIIFTKNI